MFRRFLTKAKREAILLRDAYTCFYCGDYANEVEHIIPFSYLFSGRAHDPSNLVASCRWCNAIASNKIFNHAEEKKEYILSIRSMPRWQYKLARQFSFCCDCGWLFRPGIAGASNLLCSLCYRISDCPKGVRDELRELIAIEEETLFRMGEKAIRATEILARRERSISKLAAYYEHRIKKINVYFDNICRKIIDQSLAMRSTYV